MNRKKKFSKSEKSLELDESEEQLISDEKFYRKFLIASENTLLNGGIYGLRHPKDNNFKALYFIKNDEIFEVLNLNDSKRSIFYAETLIGNGELTILSPLHPLFLVLYYLLKNAQNRFVTLDLILNEENDDFYAIRLLIQNKNFLKTLTNVTDFKEIDSELYYKYNDEKIIKWLEIRFEILLKSLIENGQLHKELLNDEKSLRHYTFGIFCDYLPESLAIILKEKLAIKEPMAFVAAVTTIQKRNCGDVFNENLSQKKTKTNSAASKRLKEASKGTKSLMSFFTQQNNK